MPIFYKKILYELRIVSAEHEMKLTYIIFCQNTSEKIRCKKCNFYNGLRYFLSLLGTKTLADAGLGQLHQRFFAKLLCMQIPKV